MLNPALFAKVKLNFEDRIVVIADVLLGSNVVHDFRFLGSNLMKFLLVYFCRHKGIRHIVLDELQIKMGCKKGEDINTRSNEIFHKHGRDREFLELLRCFLAACD